MLDKIISKLWAYADSLQNGPEATRLYDEALSHYKSQKYRNAFPLMKEAALLGEKNAMAMLGTMILFGQGTYENGEEALKWLHNAVDAGQTDTLGVLGMAYASGKGKVKRDKKLALEYLDKAAKLGDQKSIKMLDMIQKKEGMFRRDW
jgi:TPR repeat protein